MIGDEQRAAVDALLHDVRTDPTKLPIESIAAVRAAGVDVSVERHEGTAVATVKDHMHAALRKTELASRAQLIAAWYGGLGHGSDPLGPPR